MTKSLGYAYRQLAPQRTSTLTCPLSFVYPEFGKVKGVVASRVSSNITSTPSPIGEPDEDLFTLPTFVSEGYSPPWEVRLKKVWKSSEIERFSTVRRD